MNQERNSDLEEINASKKRSDLMYLLKRLRLFTKEDTGLFEHCHDLTMFFELLAICLRKIEDGSFQLEEKQKTIIQKNSIGKRILSVLYIEQALDRISDFVVLNLIHISVVKQYGMEFFMHMAKTNTRMFLAPGQITFAQKNGFALFEKGARDFMLFIQNNGNVNAQGSPYKQYVQLINSLPLKIYLSFILANFLRMHVQWKKSEEKKSGKAPQPKTAEPERSLSIQPEPKTTQLPVGSHSVSSSRATDEASRPKKPRQS